MTDTPVDTDETFLLGEKRYTIRNGLIYDSDQQPLHLRAKSTRMVDVLLEQRGRIVSKDVLAAAVWPNSVVTDESISRCVSDIRKALGDKSHTALKTFPKRGYQLNATPTDSETKARSVFESWRMVVTAMALLVAVTAVFWTLNDSIESVDPIRVRLAVLPFEFNGPPQHADYLVGALQDDLAKQLSLIPTLDIVTNSASLIADSTLGDLNKLMDELNVQYLLDGEIGNIDDQIEISAQLIGHRKSTPLWTGRYTGQQENLLNYRNQILAQVAQQLDSTISEQDLQQFEATMHVNPLAYNEVIQGRRAVSTFNYKDSLVAERHFRHAVELDSNYAVAYAELASMFAIRLENDWTVLTPADEERALYYARKAVELDPAYWFAEYVLGRLHTVVTNQDLDAAEVHLERAMLLNPANDDARMYFGAIEVFRGAPNEAIPIYEAALASHPRPPFWYYLSYGHALFLAGRNEEAATALTRCLDQMPTAPYCLRFQIANYAQLDELDDAAWSIEEYGLLGFKTTIPDMMAVIMDQHPANRALFEDSFRKAGITD